MSCPASQVALLSDWPGYLSPIDAGGKVYSTFDLVSNLKDMSQSNVQKPLQRARARGDQDCPIPESLTRCSRRHSACYASELTGFAGEQNGSWGPQLACDGHRVSVCKDMLYNVDLISYDRSSSFAIFNFQLHLTWS
jgi:hypothetical protein